MTDVVFEAPAAAESFFKRVVRALGHDVSPTFHGMLLSSAVLPDPTWSLAAESDALRKALAPLERFQYPPKALPWYENCSPSAVMTTLRTCPTIWLLVGALLCACGKDRGNAVAASTKGTDPMSSLKLVSSAFQHEGSIPAKYTCEGDDVSPPLAWSGSPSGTQSFAFVIDDPDAPDPAAPKRVWVHWVLADIPATSTAVAEDAGRAGLPSGTIVGKNDWGKAAYGGPCPPIGRHRYFHKLYALDTTLRLRSPTKSDLEKAMKGHVLATAELIGTYAKARR